ncbi:MAG: EF-P lysine aminoacylase GenX [Deltaproteobacteria bacterium]|nr:EF-P lysine aminoacylase GenX [Deltaproteobacteria bacterium]
MKENPILTRERIFSKRETLIKRQNIINAIRAMFISDNYLEIETPIRIESPAPEANIDTIQSEGRFLIASPELQMKRVVGAGYDKIFQITKCFRKDETGRTHLTEFTMLEWYKKDGTVETLINDCKEIIKAAAIAVNQYPVISGTENRKPIFLNKEWPVYDINDTYEKVAGWRPGPNPDEDRFDFDMVDKIEPWLPLDRPAFLTKYPAKMASLARLDKNNPAVAMRTELYAGGLELANGFEELTDPKIQEERFIAEEKLRREKGKPPYPIDELFINDLKLGIPNCAGMAMGLDRLIMLLTGKEEINEVVALSPDEI